MIRKNTETRHARLADTQTHRDAGLADMQSTQRHARTQTIAQIHGHRGTQTQTFRQRRRG